MNTNRRLFLKQLGLGAAAISAAGFSPTPAASWADDASSPNLPRSLPEAQGVASSGILDFVNAVNAAQMNLHSLMLVRHGQVVAEGWWAPYAADLRHTLYSLSKSFTSTAVGLAVADGRLSVDDKVVSFFPQDAPQTVSPNLAAIRVKHLLMMGAGHSSDALHNPDYSLPEKNWVRSVLSRPVDFEPGTHFTYNNGCTFLLSAIVQKVTGQTVLAYLTPRLFEPLGVAGAEWELNPEGICDGAWGLRIKTEDIAKFGQLYLQKGLWSGRRLLAEPWVAEATSVQIENAPQADKEKAQQTSDWAQGYGYQFWRARHEAFRGDGAFGQFCIVLPKQDAVIAITSETADMQAVLNAAWDHLLPAMHGESLPADAKGSTTLTEKLASLALPLPGGEPASPVSARVSKAAYAIADNALGIQRVSLSFDGNKCDFTIVDAQGEHQVACGIGRWLSGETNLSPAPLHLVTTAPFEKSKIAGGGAWSDENTFVMQWRFIETAHYQNVNCHFDGDDVRIQFTRSLSILNPANKDNRPALAGKQQK